MTMPNPFTRRQLLALVAGDLLFGLHVSPRDQ